MYEDTILNTTREYRRPDNTPNSDPTVIIIIIELGIILLFCTIAVYYSADLTRNSILYEYLYYILLIVCEIHYNVFNF